MSGIISGSQIDNSGVVGEYPTGHIIQVVQTHLLTHSTTSLTASTGGLTGYANITDLNC